MGETEGARTMQLQTTSGQSASALLNTTRCCSEANVFAANVNALEQSHGAT